MDALPMDLKESLRMGSVTKLARIGQSPWPS